MSSYRVIALRDEVATEVRSTLRSPGYGHPVHAEMAAGYGPCRLCLQPFRKGAEERLLFTYNPFPAGAGLPSPGPIFVHKDACPRYEEPGFPSGLLGLPLTLEGYDHAGLPVVRVSVNGDPQGSVDAVFGPRVAYAHIRNSEAGCFIAAIQRLPGAQDLAAL